MTKYLFLNDYSEGAHPNVLKVLQKTNLNQEIGYGEDSLTLKATELIKKAVDNSEVNIHFVSGGTQANLIVIASALKPYESVISASTGHINTHEAGAVEATGHKIDIVENQDGKIKPEQIEEIVGVHDDDHMVKPKLIFISDSTEVGTIYTKNELNAIYEVCKKHNLSHIYFNFPRSAKNSSTLLSLVAQDVTNRIAELSPSTFDQT